MDIKRVLIVLNELENMQSIIDKGFEFANHFNAKVEVLFVHETPIFNIKELFEDDKFNEDIVKHRVKELVESKTEDDVAIFVKVDDTQDRVWDLTRDDKETLIVTNYHKEITLKITNSCKQSIYIIKQNSKIEKVALLFEEFTNIDEYIEFIKNSLSSNIDLIYNFSYVPYLDSVDPLLSSAYLDNEIIIQTQEELFNNLKDKYSFNGKMFINSTSIDGELIDYLNSSNYSCIAFSNLNGELILSTKDEIIKEVEKDLFYIENIS